MLTPWNDTEEWVRRVALKDGHSVLGAGDRHRYAARLRFTLSTESPPDEPDEIYRPYGLRPCLRVRGADLECHPPLRIHDTIRFPQADRGVVNVCGFAGDTI